MAMTKAEVCRAFREVMAADYADVPAKEELNHTFSPGFYANTDALIAEQKRGSWRLLSCQSRRALVVAAILTASLLLVACTPKLREAVTELVVTVYETFVDFVADTEETPLRTEIESVYTFDPIPDGFQLESSKEFENHSIEKRYKNDSGDLIILYQSTFYASGLVDSERSEVISAVVNGNDVLFRLSQQTSVAVWVKDGYYLRIAYWGDIQQSDLERLVALVVPEQTDAARQTEIETIYAFDPVPDGFELVSQKQGNPYSVETTYADSSGASIVLYQFTSTSSVSTADMENATLFSKEISGIKVWFTSAEDLQTAIFFYDGCRFAIHYIGETTLTEFEYLVESLLLRE